MPVAEFRLYLNGQPADQERVDSVSRIQVDQAIGMATEAELQIDIGVDETGAWSDMEEEFAAPFNRVRVEVRVGSDEFTPLIDGPIVAQRFELSATPNESRMTLVVQDDSVLLNRDEEVRLFEDMTPSDIVTDLFQQYGLTPEVDNVPGPSGGLSRVIVQRGTAMQLLRELARRHGMFVYVRPGDTPGNSIGVFARPQTTSSGLPEILVLGANRNVNAFSAYFDALRPLTSRANSVRITDQTVLSSEAESSVLSPQGDEAVHDIVTPGVALLARTREDSVDLDAATTAAVDHSSWAYAARAEVVADMYAGVLSPYNVITVSGAGGHLSGNYLISRVTHLLDDENYKQQFTLRRNARSRGGNGGARSASARVF